MVLQGTVRALHVQLYSKFTTQPTSSSVWYPCESSLSRGLPINQVGPVPGQGSPKNMGSGLTGQGVTKTWDLPGWGLLFLFFHRCTHRRYRPVHRSRDFKKNTVLCVDLVSLPKIFIFLQKHPSPLGSHLFIVYYESIKREIQTRPIYECPWDERLKLRNLHPSHTLGLFIMNRWSES